jgi:DNA-binding LacI/PurR family transcriptional regulator
MSDASPRTTKARQLYLALRARLESGEFAPGARLPTEIQLAHDADVSRPTVAKALEQLRREGWVERRQGSGTFVRQRQAAARRLGLIVPGWGDAEVFRPICEAVARAAQADGHVVWWGATEAGAMAAHPAQHLAWELCERFLAEGVDGVFFAPLSETPGKDAVNCRIADALRHAHVAVVLLDRDFVPYPGRSEFDLVGINNRREGHTITDHLFAQGCGNLIFLMSPGAAGAIQARAAGFLEAHLTRRLPLDAARVCVCDPADRTAVAAIWNRWRPDGIVCGTDVTAGALMHTLEDLQIRTPDDVLIGGVDGVRYAELMRVPLTTVQQPGEALGRMAYHAMCDRLAHPDWEPRHIMLGCRLVVRASTMRSPIAVGGS